MPKKRAVLKTWVQLEGHLFHSPDGRLSVRFYHPNPQINTPMVWDAHILERIGYAIPWEISKETALETKILVWVKVNPANVELLTGGELELAQESENSCLGDCDD